MIFDAGFLVSVDRGERSANELVRAALQRDVPLVTTEPVVAQVWRNGTRQARLSRLLASITIVPLDNGRQVGTILARSGTSDVVDAHLVSVAMELRQPIVTGDTDDLEILAAAVIGPRPEILRWP